MNRIGLKDYLLNEASDSDLLDCAKAYDTANQYGHFDTQDSVEEAAKLCGWDVETALSESRHVESDADCYRFNGYGTSRPSGAVETRKQRCPSPSSTILMLIRSASPMRRMPRPRATTDTPTVPAPRRSRQRFSRRTGEGCRTLVRTT